MKREHFTVNKIKMQYIIFVGNQYLHINHVKMLHAGKG